MPDCIFWQRTKLLCDFFQKMSATDSEHESLGELYFIYYYNIYFIKSVQILWIFRDNVIDVRIAFMHDFNQIF